MSTETYLRAVNGWRNLRDGSYVEGYLDEWPNATNTGYLGDPDDLIDNPDGFIDVPGVYEGFRFGQVTVAVSGCIFRNCIFDSGFYGIESSAASGTIVTDCTFNGGLAAAISVGQNATILRNNIGGSSDGMKGQSGLLMQDNYIHDLDHSDPESHNDTIQFDTTSNITIRHNWMDCPDTSNIAMFISQVPPASNLLIERNHFGGPGVGPAYNIYLPGPGSLNVRVVDNVFDKFLHAPVTDWATDPSNVWARNVDGDGNPVPLP